MDNQQHYTYEDLRKKRVPATEAEHNELVAKCQENAWLKRFGCDFTDGLLTEFSEDYEYSFVRVDDPALLEVFFGCGWAIRTGVLYHDLAFINQVNGGDEWWTLKRFDGTWVSFESITFGSFIESGDFYEYLSRLDKATMEQCKTYTY